MEEVENLLYDDVEAKFLKLENKKKKRKRRNRKIRMMVLAFLIVAGIVYFGSDVSKIKVLKITGNQFYTEDQIKQLANVSEKSRNLLHPSFLLEWKLKRNDLIEDVKVDKTFHGEVSIAIQETKILGYYVANDKSYLLLEDGSSKEIKEENLNSIIYFPYIDGFSEEELKNLAKAFRTSGKEIESEMISMISEILPHKESYDEHMVKIVMQDGNTIYASYDSLGLLNAYKSALKDLKGKKVCIFMDAQTESLTTENCSSFK
ncbi:cell division protein FtsQ/DivIB [Amedibacterium intestinale]|uniref:cell division protein FtsQ/DivIB n=1 Tax=Amedibacterium intestinale TaxID=2583452 RepID=UPI000E20A6EE